MIRFSFLCVLLLVGRSFAADYDVCVYGGTAGGVAAAVQAARMGKSVVLIEPSKHIGGMTSGGLGWTDSGDKAAVGGIAREFYQRVKRHYDKPESWQYGKREDYKPYRPAEDAMWTFEPHVAERILGELISEHRERIAVHTAERLDRSARGTKVEGKRIVAVRTESGLTFAAKVFIDASYEGDLMAAARVSYTVGREPNSKYGETLNGVERAQNKHSHRFVVKVDPFVKPGDPASGLLFGIEKDPMPKDGEGDHRLQAFCFRLCMSNVKENSVPFPKPADYDEAKYELLFRNFEAGDLRFPMKPDMMPNGKTDTNNNCAVSTDYIGQNYKYADASYEDREKIVRVHESYQKGLMWTLANHKRVPQKIRDEMARWGLAKDEFTDNGNWPHQIYVREARRLVSDYVMTEHDCRRSRATPEPVGMGSYNMDSHNCARYVTAEGFVQNEGDVQVSPGGPYQISYRSMVPKAGECPNLLVPVCVASSHIAYGSIRMEPVFMVLGQSAATAAVLAMDDKVDVQKVEYAKLRDRLLKDKQVLDLPRAKGPRGIDPKTLRGVVVDDDQAERKGFEARSSAVGPFVGEGYRHDGGAKDGKQSATYIPDLPRAGKYDVRVSYSPNPNRATNVPVTIVHADGTTTVRVNQRKTPPVSDTFVSVGSFKFEKGTAGRVVIANEGA
ncbi:MAG: FAD-dependent oxidoreductase, partial [Zavarzinella sp.]|nr:FAD-dependent oxidoreductase [Zavarzinella sp.]